MADDPAKTAALTEHFGPQPPEVLGELHSMLRLYNLDAQELFYKWESYCIKMGPEDVKLALDTARAFKKDVQEQLEREVRSRPRHAHSATPRQARHQPVGDDMLGILGGLSPSTPVRGGVKRKPDRTHETPLKTTRTAAGASSPLAASSPVPARSAPPGARKSAPFSTRPNAGEALEILNEHIPAPTPGAREQPWEARIRMLANSDPKMFTYRPMHMKLSEASEVLDDRIDEFAALIQEAHGLSEDAFGDPSSKSPHEIVAVGRIVSDSLEGRLNAASVLLEASRRVGAGSRTPLKLDAIRSFSFFPGQIVAVKGINASGEYFAVNEVLEIPPLPPAAVSLAEIDADKQRLRDGPLRVFVAAGPYSPDDNLEFEALEHICDVAAAQKPDVVILAGPFIDAEHPMVKAGDFVDFLPPDAAGTVEDLFRAVISPRIFKIDSSLVIMVPSLRDAVSRHPAYPQEALRRKVLNLPPNVRALPNPALFALNALVFGISTADILFHLSASELSRNPAEPNPPARLTKHVLNQRHFYPLHPGGGVSFSHHNTTTSTSTQGTSNAVNPLTGANRGGLSNLDPPYLRLADFLGVVPDVLLLPSVLNPFAKVVDGVVAVNPGAASKKMAAGTWAEVCVVPRELRDGEGGAMEGVSSGDRAEGAGGDAEVGVRAWERARVEVRRV